MAEDDFSLKEVLVARGTILLRTGEDGRTEIRDNNRTVELDELFQGIHAEGTATIASEAGGRVKVDENRLLASQVAKGLAQKILNMFLGDRTDRVVVNLRPAGTRSRVPSDTKFVNSRTCEAFKKWWGDAPPLDKKVVELSFECELQPRPK